MRVLWLLPVLLLAACLPPRERLLPALSLPLPALRDFPADFSPPRSAETGLPMPGFGGEPGAGPHRTPVIFVHGSTISARYWLPVREQFLKAGYQRGELWALGYGWDSVHHFDSNDLSVPSLERTVDSVMDYLSRKRGIPVQQVDIVAHSLGVTVARQWLLQTNSYHRVRNFIAVSGANHGVWTARADPRALQRSVSWELYPGSPWLAQLNRAGETPGPTRYLSIYDGTGWADELFPEAGKDSSALAGARNLPYNREHGTWFDHLELPLQPAVVAQMLSFLREVEEPLPQAQPPRLRRQGDELFSDQPEARLHCAGGGLYPPGGTEGRERLRLPPGEPSTCYAHNPVSGLASPMVRLQAREGYVPAGELSLRAEPAGGVFEQPQQLHLSASDPAALIVYSTAGVPPGSGSPLYRPGQPIYIPTPVRVQALAISPDGRQSKPLLLDFDISLEIVEARNTLQRQFDDSAPEQYQGQRKKGR